MNGTMATPKSARRALAAAAGTCLVTLIGLWPMATEADDMTTAIVEDRGVSPNSARAGSIEAASKIVPSDDSPPRWYFEVQFVNRSTDGPEVAQFTEQVLESSVRPEMSRVVSIPRTMWSTTDRVALGPGESKTIRHELPPNVVARLTARPAGRMAAKNKAQGVPKDGRNAALARVDLVRTSLVPHLPKPDPREIADSPFDSAEAVAYAGPPAATIPLPSRKQVVQDVPAIKLRAPKAAPKQSWSKPEVDRGEPKPFAKPSTRI